MMRVPADRLSDGAVFASLARSCCLPAAGAASIGGRRTARPTTWYVRSRSGPPGRSRRTTRYNRIPGRGSSIPRRPITLYFRPLGLSSMRTNCRSRAVRGHRRRSEVPAPQPETAAQATNRSPYPRTYADPRHAAGRATRLTEDEYGQGVVLTAYQEEPELPARPPPAADRRTPTPPRNGDAHSAMRIPLSTMSPRSRNRVPTSKVLSSSESIRGTGTTCPSSVWPGCWISPASATSTPHRLAPSRDRGHDESSAADVV